MRLRRGFTIDEVGCWIADDDERAPNGYGSYLAYYEQEFGELPSGMQLMNSCGHGARGCVRPTHWDPVPEGARVRRPDPITRPAPADFAVRLRDERDARGMTVREFAIELKVKPRTLETWERGERIPDMKTVSWIARHLGWDGGPRDWLVTWVQQRVVKDASSSGEAVRVVREDLEAQTGGLVKMAVYSVKEAGRARRRRVG